ARLTKLGAGLGFEFNYADDMRMVNTFRAHQLLHWAEEQQRGHDLQVALFAAFFGERLDLNDPAVLSSVAVRIGLDADEALAVLADRRYAEAVRRRERFWTSREVSGVPAMVFDEQYLVTGAQGVDNYRAILQKVASGQAA
ncbi:MAG: DsbA family protein, partial [Pseudomonadota bacterium]